MNEYNYAEPPGHTEHMALVSPLLNTPLSELSLCVSSSRIYYIVKFLD
jgi:hypothetical protein